MTNPTPLVAALWQKNRPKVLAQIDQLASHLQSNPTEAQSIAHKLAGSLGMYGYPAGTAAARALEQELDLPTPNPDLLAQHLAALREALT